MKVFWSSCLLHAIAVLFLSIDLSSSLDSSHITSNKPDDKLALVAFKDLVTKDPFRVFDSWNDSLHFCEWPGIKCSRRHHERVTILELDSLELEGTLSPELGKLSFLKILSLNHNKFTGAIINSLTNCTRLKYLDLEGNKLYGSIPTSLANLTHLETLFLSRNELNGSIPSSIGKLKSLYLLDASHNQISGPIPTSLTNLTQLKTLWLGNNELNGSIPTSIGKLKSLYLFDVSHNQISGPIPTSLANLTQLETLWLTVNELNGSIPTSIGNLKSLYLLDASLNQISGPIPASLSNLTQLKTLWLGRNELNGSIPTSIGKLKSLNLLDVSHNQISGPIPTSLSNLTQLKTLWLSVNELYGSIPTGIGTLENLIEFDASQNRISGPIPTSLGKLTQLKTLSLSRNELNGSIPTSIGKMKSLNFLNASQNQISGPIPTSLANLTQLGTLDLSTNQLYGRIPPSLMHLPLLYVNLSRNDLNGSIPSDVDHLRSINKLDVSHNSLSGVIPPQLGYCSTLENLYMQSNFFEGKIPDSLSSLTTIYYLDLSNNKLSGEIPKGLGNNVLTYMNLSYNELEGPVPTEGIFAHVGAVSVVGNIKLCGGAVELKLSSCSINRNRKHLPFNRNRKHLSLNVAIPVIVVTLLLVLVLSFLVFCRRKLENKPSSPPQLSYENPRISYAELLDATIGFSADTLLGAGRYGTVYKGFLEQLNAFVAVKVIKLQERGAYKSFLAECNALRNLRHRNLVKILTCCSSVDFQGNDFKALVYEFISNGSLEEWLHQRRAQWHEMRSPNFLQRLNIAIDVASALDYLHHHCQPAVVHCDLKPSNILLDDEMTAHLSDFGLAKVFSATNCSSQSLATSNMVKGSIGYIPPEYGMGGMVSIKGDVYSYGILLLEMFTGRRPTDDMFQEGRNLHNFATMALPGQVMNTIDPTMLLEDSGRSINIINQSDKQARIQDCLVSVLTLGVKCSAESPMNRLNMAQVVTELQHIKEYHQYGAHEYEVLNDLNHIKEHYTKLVRSV